MNPLSSVRRFLVVDDHSAGRARLVHTMLRKFPGAVANEASDTAAALLFAHSESLDAIVIYRTADQSGEWLVQELRKFLNDVPIVLISRNDRAEGLTTGASAILDADAWLGLGTLVAGLLDGQAVRSDVHDPLKTVTV